MKKFLYKSIILSAAILTMGVQTNSLIKAQAATVTESPTTISSSDDEVSVEKSIPEKESENGSVEGNKSDNSTEDITGGATELGESGDLDEKDISVDANEDNLEIGKEVSENEENGTKELTDAELDSENTIKTQQATNRKNVSEDGNPFVEIKPITPNLGNTDDPAEHGDLMVPYVYHGNGAVYVLDENNQPIIDESSETGYKMRNDAEVYAKYPNFREVSAPFTDLVYSALYTDIKGETPTKKEQLLKALGKEGAFFMEFRNHGYDTLDELISYKNDFTNVYNKIMALNDDGTTVIESTNHGNSHSSTVKNNPAKIDMFITTIRSAYLHMINGKLVTNRYLDNQTSWHVDKAAIINDQLMYRIFENEWVMASDVM